MKTIEKLQVIRPILLQRKRVVAYASVSMETDRLKHSLSSQISYYNQYIQKILNGSILEFILIVE